MTIRKEIDAGLDCGDGRRQRVLEIQEAFDAEARLNAAAPQMKHALECIWSGVPDKMRAALELGTTAPVLGIAALPEALRKVRDAIQLAEKGKP